MQDYTTCPSIVSATLPCQSKIVGRGRVLGCVLFSLPPCLKLVRVSGLLHFILAMFPFPPPLEYC